MRTLQNYAILCCLLSLLLFLTSCTLIRDTSGSAGTSALRRGDYQCALKQYKNAYDRMLTRIRQLRSDSDLHEGYIRSLALNANNISCAHYRMENYAKAKEWALKAKEHAEASGYDKMLPALIQTLMSACNDLGEYRQAIHLGNEIISLFNKQPSSTFYKPGLVKKLAYIEMGDAYQKIGNNDDALIYYKKASAINKTSDDPALREYLSKLEEKISLLDGSLEPANLMVKLNFVDKTSLLPNNTIDAAEQSTITTTITNSGKGTAFDVKLHTESNYKNIKFPKTIQIGDIQPGESKDIKINIKAELDLNTGTVPFLITCTEKRGYDARKINLKVPAARLERPEIVVASYRINDGSTGLARGNGNGIPENGETIEITVFVKNEGAGDALNVALALEDVAPGIEVVQRESLVGTISSGQSAKAKLAFHIPRTFSGNALSFKLAASEVRLGPSATKEVALCYESNMPVLAFASRILRGGEEVERIVNGESFELEITPKNHGELGAKNVQLRVNSHDLNHSSPAVNIGDLKPGMSGSPQWFDFHIPRAFAKSKLTVELLLDQSDFAGKTDTVEIPVAVIDPKLAYTAVVSGRHGGNTIEQGERAYLEVQIQNSGGLDARDVRLKLDIVNSNVKIMDGDVRVIPCIPAGSFSETVKFDLLVLRKVQPGELPVTISLTQADFPDVDFEHKLMVKAESAEIMEVAAATRSKARHFASSGSMGPVLAIARPQNGLRVYDDNLDISGTVVDARGIDRIEVKVNGRQKSVTIGAASTINKKEFFAILPLKNGENRIIVAAYNNNDIKSEEIRIVYKAQEVGGGSHIPPLSLFCDVDKRALELPDVSANADHKKWAVVIGVEKYRRAPSVPYALRDAQAVYEYFTKLFRIPAENCFVLFDEQATLGEFRGLFEGSLPSLVRKGDTVYCYFAGHGVPDVGDQTSYLLPYDGKPSDPKWTAYASVDLYASLGRLRAKNVFVFLDACFSGAPGRSKGHKLLFEGARPGVVQIKDQILAQKNLALFAAAKSNQISNAYQEKQHGLFTYFLLKGLGGDSAYNKEGAIRVRDLADYIETNVKNISRRFGANLAQTPVVKGKRGKEDLIIVEKVQ